VSGFGDELKRTADTMRQVRERCVWTQRMTHEELVPYLIEESAELVDAVERGEVEPVEVPVVGLGDRQLVGERRVGIHVERALVIEGRQVHGDHDPLRARLRNRQKLINKIQTGAGLLSRCGRSRES
jgi:hypothetical protein